MAHKKTSIHMVIVVMALLVLRSNRAHASSFTAYAGPGCNGNSEQLNQCGCSTVHLSGGYIFTYDGQAGAAFNDASCNGVPQIQFGTSVNGCGPFGWQSIFIQC